jgi:hypothetical protein
MHDAMKACALDAALAEVKEEIRGADLVELESHELFMHRSSVVLLKGTLYTAGRASSVPPAEEASGSSRHASLEMDRPPGGFTDRYRL